jgi:predicted amidohydrolase
MIKDKLAILVVQYDIIWHNIELNLAKINSLIEDKNSSCDLIVLPEMFATGFSVDSYSIVQKEENSSILKWMRNLAKKKHTAICGSIAISTETGIYNRLYFIRPDGNEDYYDKHHLFRMSDELQFYTAGNRRTIVNYLGWKIQLNVCYDLRFPIWMKNGIQNGIYNYDISIIVANWPSSRSEAWNCLARARAIENQSYVIAVNRIGLDNKETYYQGDTLVIAADATLLLSPTSTEEAFEVTLDKQWLVNNRSQFPIALDWDLFQIVTE